MNRPSLLAWITQKRLHHTVTIDALKRHDYRHTSRESRMSPAIRVRAGNVMSRKSFVLAIAILLLLGSLVGATGFVLVRHVPNFYKRCEISAGPERKNLADEVDSELVNRLGEGVYNEKVWQVNFNETQLNAFLTEGFLSQFNGRTLENPIPKGVSDPRISLEDDRIRIGFRYGFKRFSTVISVELRPWMAVQDPNVLALEFVSLHAGAIPISSQWLLERVAEAARPLKIEVNYYRYNKHPVLVLRFQADRTNPTFQLQQVKVMGQSNSNPGFIRIAGKPSEKPKG
jgi:hypothetical protein